MALTRLQESSVLAPIARAAEHVGVDAVLFGSVACRALLFDAAGVPAKDFFELAEHAADIDIGHTGPSYLTGRFAEEIASRMTLAPWFRWSIVDRDGLAAQNSLAGFNIGVPLRQLRLGTQRLFDPRETRGLLRRALDGNIDLIRNPRFDQSPRSAFDTPASAVLVYVDAAIDVLQTYLRRAPRKSLGGPGQRDPAMDLAAEGVRRLKEMAEPDRRQALRRLWYRLAGSAIRVSPSVFALAVDYFGLYPIVEVLEQAGYPASRLSERSAIPILSPYLGNGHYRMPTMMDTVDPSRDWNGALQTALQEMAAPSWFDDPSDPIVLAPGNDVISGLRGIPIEKGESPSSRSLSHEGQEFFHLSMPLPDDRPDLHSASLTAVAIGHSFEGSSLIPAYASVSTALPWPFDRDPEWTHGGRCTVRISLPGLGKHFSKVDVYLLRSKME